MPTPARLAGRQRVATPESGRGAARVALDSALGGVDLSPAEQRFVARLCQWDKRNAAAVTSLITKARQTGRAEAEITLRQREIVLAALMDAFTYRTSGAAADGCWECANRASGLCAEHAKDADRARAFADVATALCRAIAPASIARIDSADFRRRTAVAS
ncbi:MAG: hypothetical protein ACYCO9_12955 [Streptosporangiaceae bacterium]